MRFPRLLWIFLCDNESIDFLKLSQLLSQFTNLDHAANVEVLLHRLQLLQGQMFENRVLHDCTAKDPRTMMLVWDTGASYGLTPFRSDFIDYVKCDIPVRDVTKVNRVIGIGTTLHKFIDNNGQEIFLPCVSYHLTQTDVRLFSPQTYHQMHGGHSMARAHQVEMKLSNHRIIIPVNLGGTNLPAVYNSFVTEQQKKDIGHQMRSSFAYSRLTKLDFFGDLDSI